MIKARMSCRCQERIKVLEDNLILLQNLLVKKDLLVEGDVMVKGHLIQQSPGFGSSPIVETCSVGLTTIEPPVIFNNNRAGACPLTTQGPFTDGESSVRYGPLTPNSDYAVFNQSSAHNLSIVVLDAPFGYSLRPNTAVRFTVTNGVISNLSVIT